MRRYLELMGSAMLVDCGKEYGSKITSNPKESTDSFEHS
jgi:hypothetical protein